MKALKWVLIGLGIAIVVAYAVCQRGIKVRSLIVQGQLSDALARAKSLGLPVYADQLRGEPVPDSLNAWTEIGAINQAIHQNDAEWVRTGTILLVEDKGEFLAQAEIALVHWTPLIELAKKAAHKKRYVPPRDWEMGPAMLQPDLASMKRTVEALAMKSRFELLRDDLEASQESLKIAVSLARHLDKERSTLGHLVMRSMESIIAKEIVHQATLTVSTTYRTVLREMLGELFRAPDVKRVFTDEVVLFVECTRMVSDQSKFGDELRRSIIKENVSFTASITGFSLPEDRARKFEVRAIEAACDYFESLSPELGDFMKNDSKFNKLMELPAEWVKSGYPLGFFEITNQLSGSGTPYRAIAGDAMVWEVYAWAFDIVTGASDPVEGASRVLRVLPGARMSYSVVDGGFRIGVTAADLDPVNRKFSLR